MGPAEMDSYREHSSDFDLPSHSSPESADEIAIAIGTDERRMHVRAYNYWVSLLDGRDFPSIEDLEPADVKDFEGHSILLDFTCGRDNPAVPYIGAAIRAECGLDDDTGTIADVPSRSLLSRLTDHYLQIIANRAPIGFEAEFANQRDETICYRGILMPFSSDGEAIDFIYGVINWKQVGPHSAPIESSALLNEEPLELTEPLAAFSQNMVQIGPVADLPEASAVHFSWEDGPLADAELEPIAGVELDEDAALADRLSAARETADAVKAGEGRTRAALYRALSLAFDFALAAEEDPEEYSDLLEESGVRPQARAPMTAIVKLVFGLDYDKARLTEFAAALSYAFRQSVGAGGFLDMIEKAGGLKALVASERQARRPEARPDTKAEVARARLRNLPPISLEDVPGDAEFALVLTRRGSGGMHEAVAIIADQALVERAIKDAV